MGLFNSQRQQERYTLEAVEYTKASTRRDIRNMREQLKEIDQMVSLNSGKTLEEEFVNGMVARSLLVPLLASNEAVKPSQWSMTNYLSDRKYSYEECQELRFECGEDLMFPEWLGIYLEIMHDMGKSEEDATAELSRIIACHFDAAMLMIMVGEASLPKMHTSLAVGLGAKMLEFGQEAIEELWA